MSALENVHRENWQDFIGSDLAVLVIGKTDCPACAAWSQELDAWLADGDDWKGVRFGKMMIDVPGLHAFKKASPWLADVSDLPYTVIYRNGAVEKSFYGGGLDRLTKRLGKLAA